MPLESPDSFFGRTGNGENAGKAGYVKDFLDIVAQRRQDHLAPQFGGLFGGHQQNPETGAANIIHAGKIKHEFFSPASIIVKNFFSNVPEVIESSLPSIASTIACPFLSSLIFT